MNLKRGILSSQYTIASSLISSLILLPAKTERDLSRIVLIATAGGNGLLVITVFIILLMRYKLRRKASAKNSIEAVATTQESLPNDQVNYSHLATVNGLTYSGNR